MVQLRSDRQKTSPYGLNGGLASQSTKIAVSKQGQVKNMPTKFLETLNSGDWMRIEWPGAGGWGNPKERDPELVLWDVIEEKVSIERARDIYAVNIMPDKRSIDWTETRKLRSSK